MQRLLLASNNPDKLSELRELLKATGVNLLSLSDFPELEPILEDQDTLAGNAAKKALEAARKAGLHCLADDTGLFIPALNDEPGVFAARYAGEGCSYRDNRLKVLRLLENATDRSARFVTCVALAAPDGIIAITEGRVEGRISVSERGNNGFGYDSIFEVDSTGRTYAEMADSEKNALSHRALALQKMLPILTELISIT